MKKSVFILCALLMGLPVIKSSAQTPKSSGMLNLSEDSRELMYEVQGKEMSKETEERILKTVPEEIKSKLAEIKKLDKEKYFRLLRRFPYGIASWSTGEYEGLISAGENTNKQKGLEVDTELLALKYKNADQNSKSKIKTELTSKLGELFEIRETQKGEEVKRLEKRLQDLKESLLERQKNKDVIIERRIQEMLGDSKYLKWD